MANRYELDAIISALNKDNSDVQLIAGKAKMDAKRVAIILNGKERTQIQQYAKETYGVTIGTDGRGHWYKKENYRTYVYEPGL